MRYIYLDTSYLSELTKVANDGYRLPPNVESWRRLLAVLRQGVQAGTLLCPASQFQTQEAALAPRLFADFTNLQRSLSAGLYLRAWPEVLVHQVASWVLQRLGRPHDIDLGWRTLVRIAPSVPGASESMEMKNGMMEWGERSRVLRNKFGREQSYAEYLAQEKSALVAQAFLNPQSPFLLLMLWEEAKIVEGESERLLRLFVEETIDDAPFINVFCSLWASTIFHERNRTYQPSDLLDVAALATALPHCPVVTTDRNMKNMIQRLGYDRQYGVRVFAPTARDLKDLLAMLTH